MTAVIAVSGVRSSCDMSATKRRRGLVRALMSATRFSSASAVWLNVRDRSASSSVPDTRSRVSSLPSPSRRAATPSRCTGFSTVVAAACASSAEPISARPVAMPSDQASELRSLRLGLQRLEHVAGRTAADHLRARRPDTACRASMIRCQYRWYGDLLFAVTACCLFTAVRSDSGTSSSVKVSSAPELPTTVLPSAVLGDQQHAEPLAAAGHLARRVLEFVLRAGAPAARPRGSASPAGSRAAPRPARASAPPRG